MNYYQRHLGDYTRDTAHLSMLEHGAYSLLLDRYYITESPIPEGQAHRVARARTEEERSAVDAVLAEFFSLIDGAWHNSRADHELTIATARIEAARKNGKTGGRPRKADQETEKKPTGFFLGNPDASNQATQEKALQPPTTTQVSEKPSVRRGSRLPDDWVLPKAWGEWAIAHQPTWTADHCRAVASNFADFWQAKAGKDATKLDWEKTWHTWVRRDGAMKAAPGQHTGTQGSPLVSPAIEKTREFLKAQQLEEEQIARNAEVARQIRDNRGLRGMVQASALPQPIFPEETQA